MVHTPHQGTRDACARVHAPTRNARVLARNQTGFREGDDGSTTHQSVHGRPKDMSCTTQQHRRPSVHVKGRDNDAMFANNANA